MWQVWLAAEVDAGGRVRLAADSDAALTRGLAAVVVRSLNGLTPAQLLEFDFELFQVRPQPAAPCLSITAYLWGVSFRLSLPQSVLHLSPTQRELAVPQVVWRTLAVCAVFRHHAEGMGCKTMNR